MSGMWSRQWPAAVGVAAVGLFLGAGGFGLYRVAHAEPVPAAPPQFRPASGELLPGGPAAPPIQTRPGDVLPVPELPSGGPRAGTTDPIPTKASDLPKVPAVPAEVLPPPTTEVKREAAPQPVPVMKLPSSKGEPKAPAAADPIPVLPLPTLVETPKSAPPAKSAESPKPSLPAVPGLNLQPSEPRHNVKPGQPAPVPAPVVEFPAAPAVELNPPVPTGLPVSRQAAAGPMPSGDAPMPLTVRQATRAAALGTALLAFPLFADAQDAKPTDPVKVADLDPIKEQIKELRRDVKAVKDALEGTADKGVSADDGLLRTVRRLNSTLEGLDARLKSLETKVTDNTRTALASPIAGGLAVPIAGRSVVKIVNEYPVEVSMLVNGVPHRLPPSMTKEVPVGPGTFRYQLLTSGAGEVASPIRDGETVTLRVR